MFGGAASSVIPPIRTKELRSMANVENPFIAQLRAVCLAFPEAYEQETWDAPTFRVREKIFVKAGYDERHCVAWVKARTGVQEMLISADSVHFFVPPYLGSRGWVGINLHNAPDWGEVADLVDESYRLVAPKTLIEQLDAVPIGASNGEE